MTDFAAYRARLAQIIALTTEALALSDQSNEHMLAAKLDDCATLASERLAAIDEQTS